MSTVIDSFVLEFNLDPSKFTAGQQKIIDDAKKLEEAAKKGAQESESQAKKVTELFQGVKRQAIEIIATFAGATGIKDFLKNVTATATQLNYVGQQLNMSGREISGWEGALQRMGAPAGAAIGAFKGLNKAIYDVIQTGRVSEGLGFLNRVGGVFDPKNVDSVASLSDVFLRMSKWAHDAGLSGSQAFNYFMRIPGMTEEMARFLSKPPEEMRKMVTESENALKVTKLLTTEAASFTDQWAKTRQQIQGAGNDIMTNVYPHLEKVVKLMGDFAEKHPIAGAVMNFAESIVSGIGAGGGAVLAYLAATRGGSVIAGAGRAAASGVGGVIGGAARAVPWIASLPVAALGFYFGSTVAANADESSRKWWEPLRPASAPMGALPQSGTLKVKPGAGEASDAMRGLMAILAGDPEIKEVTALADAYHRRLGANDPHSQGRAMDVTIIDPSKSTEAAEEIRARLAAAGVSAKVIDEYLRPSRNATGGHIHIGLPPGARAAAAVSTINNSRAGNAGPNSTTVTAHIGEVNVNAPGVKNVNDASAQGIAASTRSSLAGFNWNPP